MKKLIIILVALFLLFGIKTGVSEKNSIHWTSYQEGFNESKPTILYFYSLKSQICNYTNNYIFSNNEIINKSKEFTMVKINVDEEIGRNIALQYKLQYMPYLPTVIFLSKDRIELHRLIAYDVYDPKNSQQSIENFLDNMEKALKGKIWGDDFSFVTLNGKIKHLKDYRGKVVLVDLMATWCQPCRMQMNELEKVLNHFGKNDGIVIISIDVERSDNANKIKSTFSSHINEWTFGMDKYGIAQKYLLENSIPTLVIFDKYGRISYLRPGLTSSQDLIDILSHMDIETKQNKTTPSFTFIAIIIAFVSLIIKKLTHEKH